jgi:uncharacterized membrane protein
MAASGRNPTFDTIPLLKRSWDIFVSRFGPLFVAHLVFNLVVSSAASALCGVGGVILAGPLWYGLCRMALCAVRDEPTPYEDMFAGFRVFWPTFLVGAIMTLFAAAGAVVILAPTAAIASRAFVQRAETFFVLSTSVGGTLSLIPTCVVLVLYAPAFFFIHDRGLDARSAMEASRRMVCRNPGCWLRLWAGLSVLHLAGLLTCCLGLFIATPWMVVALALAYEHERPPGNSPP